MRELCWCIWRSAPGAVGVRSPALQCAIDRTILHSPVVNQVIGDMGGVGMIANLVRRKVALKKVFLRKKGFRELFGFIED